MLTRICRTAALCTATTVLLPWARPAEASDQGIKPAEACVAVNDADPSISFDWFGAYNQSTVGAKTLTCGVGQDRAVDNDDDIRIYFVDNNGTNLANLSCQAFAVDEDWSSMVSLGTKYGCSTPDGCDTSPTGSVILQNYITFANVTHGGAFQFAVSCAIPAKAGGFASYVKGIFIDQQ